MNVQHRVIRRPTDVAVVDAAVPAQGWVVLDLERRFQGLSGLFSRPVMSLGGPVRLSETALGGALARPAALPPLLRKAERPPVAAHISVLREVAPQTPPGPPRRIPAADIVFVGRPQLAASPAKAKPKPAPTERRADAPPVRQGVRPWLAVASVIGFAVLGFYWGTRCKSCRIIEVPATMNQRNAIVWNTASAAPAPQAEPARGKLLGLVETALARGFSWVR